MTYSRKKAEGAGFLETGSSDIPLTYELNSSLVLLPETPMKSRLFDPRVGYFTYVIPISTQTHKASNTNNSSRAGDWNRKMKPLICAANW